MFINEFKSLNLNTIKEIKFMVYTNKRKETSKALAKFGMLEGDKDTPVVTVNPL